MTTELTARQREVLEFIKANTAYYSPSVREIAAALSIRSPNAVTNHLVALEKKGAIRRRPGEHRNIEVVA